ncbi:hypothetical protein NIES4102_24480 [Chondrocystis sp. NIES-4102]|nr:hypothetical protein NIES4102_24480 [Chondrocystis sp. NIES-4102]
MLDTISFSQASPTRSINVVIVESHQEQGMLLCDLLNSKRANFNIVLLENSDLVFSSMYGEIEIDVLIFDIESEAHTDNISLLKAISPETSLVHWSDYQHPEVIELLYSLGVNTFCTKESDAAVILEATDLAVNYPQSLYIDQKLNSCLPLLQS